MTYYTRYLTTAEPLTFEDMERLLPTITTDCELDGDVLVAGDDELGQLDVSPAGHPFFADDIELLERFAEEKRNKDVIISELRRATSMITIQVLNTAFDGDKGDPLEQIFEWLVANHPGILADEGGQFYNRDGPLE